ncbi:MBL fold metallo-hydrolase [Streptomyces sp. NPDC005132]|uniref:MBL fold metallo-hydrolase n=1 Tax=Streptomyces sp. NPDC005132 TaxID=3154294 RepID=UPI00339DF186
MNSTNTGQLAAQAAIRTLTRADVRLTYIVDSAMAFSPSRFFPSVPAAYWEQTPGLLDDAGRIPMSAGGLLVERGGRTLLIDTGLGPISKNPLGVANSGSLLETLDFVGTQPADIDTVAFTHLHIDHTGWAFTPDTEGDSRPTFAQARYAVAREEWAPHARGEIVPDEPHGPLFSTLSDDRLVLVDNGEEVFPGVYALVTPGHTAGHASYVIHAGGERIIVFGDAFHHPVQITHPEYGSEPDLDSVAVPPARRIILKELEAPGTLGFAFHFGDHTFGRAERNGESELVWQPVPSTVLGPSPREV